MSYDIHAVAIDYDGTLTNAHPPGAAVLEAVRAVRAAGIRCVLVTGRILTELRAVFPDVANHFDAIVGENGAVAAGGRHGSEDLVLAAPVARELEAALSARGVPVRDGHVLLATQAVYDPVVNEEIRRLGLESQIVRNRGELMVLPAGVSKGTGLVHALDELNLSPHSAVAIGDAENDHSLLDACEIGVAVGNAIASLRAHADIVLAEPNGAGVASFLAGPLLQDLPGVEPGRWRLTLGTWPDGSSATVAASRISIAVEGPSGGGKSWFAGALAEQLIAQRYTVCVLDFEGDHVALGALHGVVVVGGDHPLLPVDEVVTLLGQGITSVVVDLSLEDAGARHTYADALLAALHRTRRASGTPQWTFIDEAHVPLLSGREGWWHHEPWPGGMCVITYRPDLLSSRVRGQSDWIVTIEAPDRATLRRRDTSELRAFRPIVRGVAHVRHWHKYADAQLPPERRFHFRDGRGVTGRVAGNITEFGCAIDEASPGVLRHHAINHDFSRWLYDLCRDRSLFAATREIEAALAVATSPEQTEPLRARLRSLVSEEFAR